MSLMWRHMTIFLNIIFVYNNLDISNVNTYKVNGINNGITYYYRVRTYSAGCSTITSKLI